MRGSSPQDVPGQVGGPKPDDESYLIEDLPLDPFDDVPGDDAEARDLEIGVSIDELSEGDDEAESTTMDLGNMLSGLSEDGELAIDDGPIAIDLTQGLELYEAPREDGGDESVDEGPIALDETRLPELDRDVTGEGAELVSDSLGLVASDESSLPRAAEPWQLGAPAAPLEACSSLVSAGDQVVGASSDLLWFTSGADAPLRLAVDNTSVSSLILIGAHDDVAIAATRGGKLWRRARQASQAVPIGRGLEIGSTRGGRPLELARPSLTHADELWLHVGDGRLLRSTDGGEHFAQIELAGSVLKLASAAPTLLLEQNGRRALAQRRGAGFELCELSGVPAQMAGSPQLIFAAEREHCALATSQRAVQLSIDGGRAFRTVPGTANASALCFARFRDRDRLWVAIYREALDQTAIALVDLEHARAECVAVLKSDEGEAGGDPAERTEWGRVSALAWHAPSARLWAAGGFGLRCLNPLE